MNVFKQLRRHGTDENFIPLPATKPSKNPPGSLKKIEDMTERVKRGEAIFHDEDVDFEGCVGDGKPGDFRARR